MKKCFLSIFFLLPILVFGQDRVVNLTWMEEDSLISFKQASYQEEMGQVPVYTDIIPWPDVHMTPRIKAIVYSSSPLKEKYKNQVKQEYLKPAPLLSYGIVFEKKVPYLQLRFAPFFVNKETGKTEFIESFELKISEESQMASLKSMRKGNFSDNSVLATNDWYKIAIEESGIHKLSYEDLIELGIGNPATVKIFGAGAILLPEDYSKGAYDDLSELPVYMNKGSDQLFGPGDFILFYAQGPHTWSYDQIKKFYSQELHPYSTRGYYFLTDDMGVSSSPQAVQLSTDVTDHVINTYDILSYYEEEKYNLLNSGKEWYGQKFYLSLDAAFPFTLKNLVPGEEVKIRVTAAGRSNEDSRMNIKANSTSLGSVSFSPVNLSSYTSKYAVESDEIFDYKTSEEITTIQIEYVQPNSNSEAWLNHITLNGRSSLRLIDNQLAFRDAQSVLFGETGEFRVQNVVSNTIIWDVTDPVNPQSVQFTLTGNTASFKVPVDELNEYVAFNPNSSFPVPLISGVGLGKISNQNLHGTAPPDMLIVYAEEFKEHVERLEKHRREHDQLDILSVTQEMVFNEFSSGTPNISALRNYLKMFYDADSQNMIKYLLLFGDGSFDNRDTVSNNPNKILTFQSDNSLVPTASFVSDDFFGLLDTGEKIYDGLLDVGIGRLPVSTVAEAELVVDKIIEYDQKETLGEWRNYICLIGDDQDGNVHMRQANSLADYIESTYPSYNINKIFLDAYSQVTTPTGDLYPDVTRAINDQMNRGALIINYTGHGSVTGLAHEKILNLTNIKSWKNKGKYPLFMTATCEFSRYDEYDEAKEEEITSAGEEVLMNPNGGSIALFTTTRLVYSGPNHVLNEKFYEIVFEKRENGDCYRLGDVIVYSKNRTGPGINKRNFTLLGDPSIRLSFPKNVVMTDSVNHVSIEESSDTISALDFVTISGHLEDQNGNPLNTMNGTIIPIVYDKKSNLKTLSNDGDRPMEFQSRTNIIYKGNATVQDGKFSFSFYVPKDISYNVGEGKISYYSYDENSDGHGSTTDITIGGLGDVSEIDTTGPEISVYMNDSLFKDGGIVNNSPELLIYVEDPFGINTTGNGIGHDITATLNEDRINTIILNEYYQSDTDSYSSGSVRYPYNDLALGKHTIEVKVWDIFNNSSTKMLNFRVVESLEMLLNEIYNYPNPFIEFTYFNIEHNRPGQDLEIVIRIYDMMGNLVTILENQQYSSGYRLDPVLWTGQNRSGSNLGGGMYIYKVLVRSAEGEEAVESGRLIIKR